jgi:hypothetical protein
MKSTPPETPLELDRIVDVVLAYRPKSKTKAAKRRTRRKKREEKRRESVSALVPS